MLRTLALAVLILTSACTATQLRTQTLAQARTLTDLQYQIVLDNIAMQRAAAGALPWHVKISEGSVTTNDSAGPTASIDWSPTTRALELTGSREWQASWTLIPVTNSEQLTKLQGIYAAHSGDTWILNTPPPEAVPRGQYASTTVWVAPQDLAKLSGLVLAVLAAAPIDTSERFFLGSAPNPTIR